jgi:hypothetical protein
VPCTNNTQPIATASCSVRTIHKYTGTGSPPFWAAVHYTAVIDKERTAQIIANGVCLHLLSSLSAVFGVALMVTYFSPRSNTSSQPKKPQIDVAAICTYWLGSGLVAVAIVLSTHRRIAITYCNLYRHHQLSSYTSYIRSCTVIDYSSSDSDHSGVDTSKRPLHLSYQFVAESGPTLISTVR